MTNKGFSLSYFWKWKMSVFVDLPFDFRASLLLMLSRKKVIAKVVIADTRLLFCNGIFYVDDLVLRRNCRKWHIIGITLLWYHYDNKTLNKMYNMTKLIIGHYYFTGLESDYWISWGCVHCQAYALFLQNIRMVF